MALERMEGVFRKSVYQEGHVDVNIGFPNMDDIRIRGSFPRIKPRTERPELDGKELKTLESKLWSWANEYFDLSKRPQYFQNLAAATISLVPSIEPWTSLDSDVMDVEMKFVFWCSLLDDYIEESPPTAARLIREQNEYFERLWCQDVHPSTLAYPPEFCDLFAPLCDSLVYIRERMRLYQGFEHGFSTFIYYRTRYDRATELICSIRNQQFLNLDMFRYWRNIVFYVEGITLTFAMLHGILPGKVILESPYMLRLFEVANSYGFLVNDIFGIKKDFEKKEQNIILFKLKGKLDKTDLQKELNICMEQIIQKLKEDVVEYLDLRGRLVNLYQSNSKLLKFLDLLDNFMDGQLHLYVQSPRYILSPTDSISLKRSV